MTLQIKYNLWMTSKVESRLLYNFISSESIMFNSLMPSLNSRYLPFVVFLGAFPSRCQDLSRGAIRPGGLLLSPAGAVGPGTGDIATPPVCLSVRLSVRPSRLVFAL